MKETIHRLERFAFYDFGAIQTHLEEMAAQGWMIEKLGNVLWRYRRREPQALHFSVTYFPNATESDPSPTEGQQLLEEFGARQGWMLAVRWGQMQIFYNEGENPVPMETDAVTQVETIHRAMKKGTLPSHCFMIALCLYQLVFCGIRLFSNPIGVLSSPSSLYLLLAWLMLLLSAALEIGFYFAWHRKAKTLAESGVFWEMKTKGRGGRAVLALSMLLIGAAVVTSASGVWAALGWGWFAVLLGFFLRFLRDRLKSRGVSRRTNRVLLCAVSVVLTFAVMGGLVFAILHYGLYKDGRAVGTYDMGGWELDVYDDALPLQVEELTDVPQVNWSKQARRSATVLLSSTEYTQYPLSTDHTIPNLNYTVTDIKIPALYDFCKNRLLHARKDEMLEDGMLFVDHYEPTEAAPWGAAEAYQVHWSDSVLDRYLLFYENRIVEIGFDSAPAPAQMAIVGDRLGT